MKLQHVIWPSMQVCEELYFRKKGDVEQIGQDNVIYVSKGSEIKFDTYFNGFSLGKWKRYTNVEKIYITLKINGQAKLSAWKRVSKDSDGEILLQEAEKEAADEEVTVEFTDVSKTGILYFKVHAITDCYISDGYYWTNAASTNKGKIALDICTYKREKYIQRNLHVIDNSIFAKKIYAEFSKYLDVFVIDNAGTLEKEIASKQYIYLVRNKNVGGAGGFTRGLIEIKKLQEREGYTHALLMDDDIVLEPEILFRTWTLLLMLKEEYKNAFIGGSMLRLDEPFIQTESGAVWNSGKLISRKSGLDLRDAKDCFLNEAEEEMDYCAWWYCVIPLEIVNEKNLPLPIFIRGDDVEYGSRNAKNIITMNGIGVWHEPFENKNSSFLFYYLLRNWLIDNAVLGCALSKKEFIHIMKNRVRAELYLYHYKNIYLLMQGVLDFCKGIDWLKEQDGEELHEWVMKNGYAMKDREELGITNDVRREVNNRKNSFLRRIWTRITLNGIFMKPNKEYAVIPTTGKSCFNEVYRVKKVLNFDEANQKGFWTYRDNKEVRDCLALLRRTIKITQKLYERTNREYRERYSEVTNEQFWKKYLGI